MSRRETNPHFSRPLQPQHDDHQQPPVPTVLPQDYRGQPPTFGAASMDENVPHYPRYPLRPTKEDRVPLRTQQDRVPFQSDLEDHPQSPILRATRREERGQPQRGGSRKQPQDQGFRPPKSRVNFQEPSQRADGIPVPPPPDHPAEPRQPQPHHHRQHAGIKLPKEQKSPPLTWMGACLCVIFWLVIIIGGLIVLIVYLVFRPQSPHFDVPSVTLNAAYLDFGSLLNADINLLANFTNPNKKVHVDFSSVIIYLYYGSTLIASQYVEPFSAARVQSRLANIHMITSQVQLPLRESQRLVKQMESNGVLLEVRGVFRARSKLGTILRYSYNLYGRCYIMVTRPPDGILLKRKCRTKR